MFGWEWKSGGMEKVSLYKVTHISLLKNDGQLKQINDKQPKKKKKKKPNSLKKKSCKKKKSCLVKQRKKKKKKKRK